MLSMYFRMYFHKYGSYSLRQQVNSAFTLRARHLAWRDRNCAHNTAEPRTNSVFVSVTKVSWLGYAFCKNITKPLLCECKLIKIHNNFYRTVSRFFKNYRLDFTHHNNISRTRWLFRHALNMLQLELSKQNWIFKISPEMILFICTWNTLGYEIKLNSVFLSWDKFYCVPCVLPTKTAVFSRAAWWGGWQNLGCKFKIKLKV